MRNRFRKLFYVSNSVDVENESAKRMQAQRMSLLSNRSIIRDAVMLTRRDADAVHLHALPHAKHHTHLVKQLAGKPYSQVLRRGPTHACLAVLHMSSTHPRKNANIAHKDCNWLKAPCGPLGGRPSAISLEFGASFGAAQWSETREPQADSSLTI